MKSAAELIWQGLQALSLAQALADDPELKRELDRAITATRAARNRESDVRHQATASKPAVE